MKEDFKPKKELDVGNKDKKELKVFSSYLKSLSIDESLLSFWEYMRSKKPDSFRIIDVGCGKGDFLKYLIRNEVPMIYNEEAKSRFSEKNIIGVDKFSVPSNFWQLKADIAKMPIADNSCDVVLVKSVMPFFMDSEDLSYPLSPSDEAEPYNFEKIIYELLRVTSDPGVCMFELPTYEQIEREILFQEKYPNMQHQLSVEQLEKRKIFLKKSFAFLQELREHGYAVNFHPVDTYNEAVYGTRVHIAVHITKNPLEYAKLQQEVLYECNFNAQLEKQLYLKNYPDKIGFTLDHNYELYPGAKNISIIG